MYMKYENYNITILHAGGETHYLNGLISGLVKIKGININIVGSNKTVGLFDKFYNVKHFNLRGEQNPDSFILQKITRIIKYYVKLFIYVLKTDSELFHIQWLNKFYFFDRTFLLLYYKILGKKIVFTAHNVDDYGRPGQKSSKFNKWSLKFFYENVNHIIVHTQDCKLKLSSQFNIPSEKISVIPHGINILFPLSKITSIEAREKLNIQKNFKIILFFGMLKYYKGVDILIDAFELVLKDSSDYFLILAGYPSDNKYVELLQTKIKQKKLSTNVLTLFKFIDDNEIELIMKAADCLVLPYRGIYQSGVLFLGYAFGLPIIASNVGNFSNDIIENKTGYIFNNEDITDLSIKIKNFFQSELFLKKENTRKQIIKYANDNYSWEKIGLKTFEIYKKFFSI